MKKITETPSLYDNIDKMSAKELLISINSEDAKVAEAVKFCIPSIEKLVEQCVTRVRDGGRVFYIGAGTSGRLGVLDASELPPTFGVPEDIVIGLIAGGDVALRKAVENAEDAEDGAWEDLQRFGVNKKDVIVGIAASGATPYVIGGLRKGQEEGLLTASIACNPDSPIAEYADIKIEALVGPEFVTGSTRMKSGTAQKLILNMFTTSLMIMLGRVKGNKMVNMQLTNKKLVDRGTRMLVDELKIDYSTAECLLLLHGSVDKAIMSYNCGDI
ncbi:MAG: N-acetylmuramic acid 6-phosphate etherase [Bacteroidales bacterium]